jgi:hypothetical protein
MGGAGSVCHRVPLPTAGILPLMASINNPAGRLYLLLARLREADGDRPLIITWSDILGQPQDLVREHLGAVAELVTQIDAAAAEPGREQVAAPVARYRGQWLEATFPLERPFSQRTANFRPSDEAYEALGLVAAILEVAAPDGAIPSEEDRAVLIERLRALVQEVTTDEQLPDVRGLSEVVRTVFVRGCGASSHDRSGWPTCRLRCGFEPAFGASASVAARSCGGDPWGGCATRSSCSGPDRGSGALLSPARRARSLAAGRRRLQRRSCLGRDGCGAGQRSLWIAT